MQKSEECSVHLVSLNSINLVFDGGADSRSFNIVMAETVRILLPQEEWSKEGELGWRPASESWAAWSFLLLKSQQRQLMTPQVAKTGGIPALPSLATAANLTLSLAMEQLKIDYSLG